MGLSVGYTLVCFGFKGKVGVVAHHLNTECLGVSLLPGDRLVYSTRGPCMPAVRNSAGCLLVTRDEPFDHAADEIIMQGITWIAEQGIVTPEVKYRSTSGSS